MFCFDPGVPRGCPGGAPGVPLEHPGDLGLIMSYHSYTEGYVTSFIGNMFWFDQVLIWPQGAPGVPHGVTLSWCLSSLNHMQRLLSVNTIGFNLRVLEGKIPHVKTRFWQFRWVFLYNIGCLGLQSLRFYAKSLILAKFFNFRHPHPLILSPIEKSQNGSFTNKQKIFFKFLISKSFLLLWMFIDGNMKKNHYCKHCQNSIFCFSLKSWFFRYVILKRPPIGQIWPLRLLGWLIWLEMSQIFDISSKKLRSEKVYHKCVKQPGH